MTKKQGDVSLLNDPLAQQLLKSDNMAHLAYNWKDGTPRVIPIWFHWDGKNVVIVSPEGAPKLNILENGQQVAISIDEKTWPYYALYIRGPIMFDWVNGVAEEYIAAAKRYLGEEAGSGWVNQVRSLVEKTGRITVKPEWVGLIHLETRLPSAVEKAIARASR